jgi:cytochrome P450
MVETKVFRRDVFYAYEQNTFPHTIAETLAPFLTEGGCDLVDFGNRVMLNLTADFSGIDRPARTAAETTILLGLLRSFGKAATLGQATGDRDAIRAEVRESLAVFDAAFFTPSRRRREALIAAGGAVPRDVLTVLLQFRDQLPDSSHDTLLKELAFYLLAGAFTSVHSMTDAMHELFVWQAAHPAQAARVLADPVFAQSCVMESMRLHPSSAVACRKPTGAAVMPAVGEVGPEDVVMIDLLAATKDASRFGEDAAAFRPGRETLGSAGPYGLSFGLGAHACIGRNLAAGALPRGDIDPAEHHYGTITLLVLALLRHGARPDPADPAKQDPTITRVKWARYPVLFTSPQQD